MKLKEKKKKKNSFFLPLVTFHNVVLFFFISHSNGSYCFIQLSLVLLECQTYVAETFFFEHRKKFLAYFGRYYFSF